MKLDYSRFSSVYFCLALLSFIELRVMRIRIHVNVEVTFIYLCLVPLSFVVPNSRSAVFSDVLMVIYMYTNMSLIQFLLFPVVYPVSEVGTKQGVV